MARYITQEPPYDPEHLPEYLGRELRQVEAALQPDAWIDCTLENGWVTYGLGYNDPQFMKDANEFVHIRGLIKDGTTTAGTTLFTLPEGYRPLARYLFTVQSVALMARIDALGDGRVIITAPDPSSGWLAMDGVHFLAEQ